MADRPAVSLAELTTLRLGGRAGRVVEAADADELVETVLGCDLVGEPVLVLGSGSNVVVADAGFPGTVVLVRSRGRTVEEDGPQRVWVSLEAGEDWDAFVAEAVDDGLAGVEVLSGIPGRCGAAPIQNVGAYGQEIATSTVSVRVYDRTARRTRTLTGAECGFGYRTSCFKRQPGHHVVLGVTLSLRRSGESDPLGYPELARRLGVPVGARVPLALARSVVLDLRRAKGMLLDPGDRDTWSAGSFFTNPVLTPAAAARLPPDAPRWPQPDGTVKTSAAWLIERAGFGRGYGTGPARLSSKHPLALTNRGGASTAQLLELGRQVRAGVRERFGVELVNEPVTVGCSL